MADYGTTTFEGKEYTLTSNADFNFWDNDVYTATAVDADGNKFKVDFDILDKTAELDSGEFCNWDNASNVRKIDDDN